VAPSGAAPYLPRMAGDHDPPFRGERSAIFSRAEIRWLGAVVAFAVIASVTAALVSDKTFADLLGGFAPAAQPASADG
jgi:hypothetical protein